MDERFTTEGNRLAAVIEARSWVDTPYVKGAMVKGAGVDCAKLLVAVFAAAGIVPMQEIEHFAADWWMHTDTEEYMLRVLRHGIKTVEGVAYASIKTEPGNIVLLKAAKSRVWNHGGIITQWPRLVHAINPKVAEIDATRHPMWSYQQVAIFDPWGKQR